MKKIKLFMPIVVFVMLLTVQITSSTTAFAYSTYWWVSGDTLYISGYGEMLDYSFGSQPWESYSEDIYNVVIGEGVTSIGEEAFAGMGSISSVSFPSTLRKIEDGAFSCCNLQEVIIPEGVTEIGDNVFGGNLSLYKISFPESLQKLGIVSYSECSSSLKIIIPGNVSEISCVNYPNSRSFNDSYEVRFSNKTYDSRDNCKAIIETATNTLIYGGRNSTIPNGVECIYNYAFSGVYWLSSVTIPESVKTINKGAFSNCLGLKTIYLIGDITSIASDAFSGTDNITVYYTDNCKIAHNNYGGNLTWVKMPMSGSCGDDLNWEVSGDGVLTVTGTGKMYDYDNPYMPYTSNFPSWKDINSLITKVCVNGGTSIGNNAFSVLNNVLEIDINGNVNTIGEGAFSYCSKLEKVSISNNVETIKEKCFYACESLCQIDLPNSIQEIGESAFGNCNNLKRINLPSSLKRISAAAFWLSGIERITIPASVEEIGEDAFYYCNSLQYVDLQGNTSINENAFLYTTTKIFYTSAYKGNRNGLSGTLTWIYLQKAPSHIEKNIKEGTYIVHSALNNNLVLDISESSMEDRANIQLYNKTNNETQKFSLYKEDGRYYIKSNYSEKWLDIRTPIEDGSNVQLWNDNSSPEEKWFFEDAGDGYVYIRSITGYYLTVQGGTATNNANVNVEIFSGNNNQKWRLGYIFDGEFGDLNGDNQINSDDAIYLLMYSQFPADYPLPEDTDYDLNNDGQINSNDAIYLLMHTQFPDDESYSITRKFTIGELKKVNLEEGIYEIASANNQNYVFDISANSKEDRANIQVYYRENTSVQRYKIIKEGDYYIIKSIYSGKWLDIKTPISSGSNVQLWSSKDSEEEKWQFYYANNGAYFIKSKTGYFINLSGNACNNANVNVTTFDASSNQMWYLNRKYDYADITISSPVVVTTIGQADLNTMTQILDKAGIWYTSDAALTASSVNGGTVIMVVGGSNYGLGSAGVSASQEISRGNAIISRARSTGANVMCFHLGGSSRRGSTSDLMIEPMVRNCDYLVVAGDGDSDGSLSYWAGNTPVTVVADTRSVVEVVAALK